MTKPKKQPPLSQSIGGVLFGFEQQIFRNQPPPHELVHHARPDNPVPAGDGGFVTFDLPAIAGTGPLAGLDFEPDPLTALASDLADPIDAAPDLGGEPEKD